MRAVSSASSTSPGAKPTIPPCVFNELLKNVAILESMAEVLFVDLAVEDKSVEIA